MTESPHNTGENLIRSVENLRAEKNADTDETDGDNIRIIVKESEKRSAEADEGDADDDRHDTAEQKDLLHNLMATHEVAGTVILTDEGNGRLTEGIDDEVTENFDIISRCRSGHDVGAQAVDGRLNNQIGNGEDHTLHAGRQADGQHTLQHVAVNAKIARYDMKNLLLRTAEQNEEDNRAECIGDDRCNRNALDIHMADDDEEEVEDDIDAARNGKEDERRFRISLAAENRRLEIIQHIEWHAAEINAEIAKRKRRYFRRNTEQFNNRNGDEIAEQSDDDAADKGHDDGGMNGLIGALRLILSRITGDDDIRTDRDAGEEIDEQADDRSITSDGCHGFLADEGADNRCIRSTEKLLQHARQRKRQGEFENLISDASVEKIHRIALLLLIQRLLFAHVDPSVSLLSDLLRSY